MSNKQKNELVDVAKIREIAEAKYKSLEMFGKKVLGLKHRQLVSERLANKSRFTADEIFTIAEDFGLSADDLRKVKTA